MAERINVAVRVRPFLPHESPSRCVTVRGGQLSVGDSRNFAFDHVFDMKSTSDDVYGVLGQPLADAFLAGYHASTIAYGQTGAGKTFTMAALLHDTVQEIFRRLNEEADTAATTSPPSITLTVLEVYNDSVGDLLSRSAAPLAATAANGRGRPAQTEKETTAAAHASLPLREDPHGGVYVVGLTEMKIEDETSLLVLIDTAIGNRKTATTMMNAASSRSHCVITLTLQRNGLCSRCCFVDLAGSERLKKSHGMGTAASGGVAGDGSQSLFVNAADAVAAAQKTAVRMREGININSGLLALGNVIVALCDRKPHVPYRNSKLTRLLQPMLEGHSRTAMVACVAPVASSLEETLNTLKYADRAKRIEIDPRLAVAPASTAEDAERIIASLRAQLEEAQQLSAAQGAPAPGMVRSHVLEELEHVRALLVQEQEITRRLESDLFNAEYTAMVEMERRKTLEAQLGQLQAAHPPHHCSSSLEGGPSNAEENVEENAAAAMNLHATRQRNLEQLRRLEEERASLVAEQAQQVRESARLTAHVDLAVVIASRSVHTATAPCDSQGVPLDLLTAEVQHKEEQVAQLQRDRDAVVARLAQYKTELTEALWEKTQLQEGLRKAELQLERTAMEREAKEQEKMKLRAAYMERLRKAEELAGACQRQVREAEQEAKKWQERLTESHALQQRVLALREEVTRQRVLARASRKDSEARSTATQQEMLRLQRQLQASAVQVAHLHQRLDRKEAAIARVKQQLEEQGPREAAQATARDARPPPLAAAPARLLMHRQPSEQQSSLISLTPITTPSPAPLFSQGSSRQGRPREKPLLSVTALSDEWRSEDGGERRQHQEEEDVEEAEAAGTVQAQIDRELQELERMEKELADLEEYRTMLFTAHTNDAPKWHRAKAGFTRKLDVIREALQEANPPSPRTAELLTEEADVVDKLRQLQTYQSMFEDADQQLAEFDNRIENLNEARRFHLRHVRRLQQANTTTTISTGEASHAGSAAGGREGDGRANGAVRSRNATALAPLPTVRDIESTRQHCAALAATAAFTRAPVSRTGASGTSSKPGYAANYVNTLEYKVATLTEETRLLRAQLRVA